MDTAMNPENKSTESLTVINAPPVEDPNHVPTPREIRALLKGTKVKEGTKSCGICGLVGARNHSKVNEECPAHREAVEKKYDASFNSLEKALGNSVLDFATRGRFNGQLEFLRGKITAARMEHAAWVEKNTSPESKEDSLAHVLTDCLGMLGFTVKPNANHKEGKWSTLSLADVLRSKLGERLNPGTESSDEMTALVVAGQTDAATEVKAE
jgi:hypothetical protein